MVNFCKICEQRQNVNNDHFWASGSCQISFSWVPTSLLDGDCSHEIKRCLLFGRKAITNLDSTLKSRDITLLIKVHVVKAMVFPVVMYGCESWTIKKAEHWRIDALELWWFEKTPESFFDCKEIQPVNSKGNEPWIFTGRIDAEVLILWPPDVKSQLTGKDPKAGNDWGKEERGMTEDEMVGWHHWLNGHEFEQTQGDSEGQGSLVCCSSWGPKQLDTTYQLNNNNNEIIGNFSFL